MRRHQFVFEFCRSCRSFNKLYEGFRWCNLSKSRTITSRTNRKICSNILKHSRFWISEFDEVFEKTLILIDRHIFWVSKSKNTSRFRFFRSKKLESTQLRKWFCIFETAVDSDMINENVDFEESFHCRNWSDVHEKWSKIRQKNSNYQKNFATSRLTCRHRYLGCTSPMSKTNSNKQSKTILSWIARWCTTSRWINVMIVLSRSISFAKIQLWKLIFIETVHVIVWIWWDLRIKRSWILLINVSSTDDWTTSQFIER